MTTSDRYAGIAETALDAKELSDRAESFGNQPFIIIALSLEALEFLRQRKVNGIEIVHVWEIVAMEPLLDKAHDHALAGARAWAESFSTARDIAIEHRLQAEFLPHAYASRALALELARIFKEKNWVYVPASTRMFFLSIYAPEYQKHINQNFLFKVVCLEYFNNSGIRIAGVRARGILARNAPLLAVSIIADLFVSIWRDIKDRLKLRPTLRRLDIKAHADAVITGWGRDLSRMLSLSKLARAHGSSRLRILNLIWRSQKIEIPATTENFKQVLIREDVRSGTTRGPRLSMFNITSVIKGLCQFYVRVFLPRLVAIYRREPPATSALADLLGFAGFRSTLAYNVYFSLWENFWTERIMRPILKMTAPTALVGSDSGGVSARTELLIAAEMGIRTFSTPHGYQAYALPRFNYIADSVLTHASATRAQIEFSGIPGDRIIYIGTSHPRRDQGVPITPGRVRIIVGTRSWSGLWSNAASRHDAYDRELRYFLNACAAEPAYSVVIKSHPNGDYHGYYDLLARSFDSPRISHVRQGWKPEKFADSCDILICFGDTPSLFITAAYLKIPIVFVTGTMSMTQKKMNYDYANVAAVVPTAKAAFDAVRMLADNRTAWQSALEEQEGFLARYTGGDPEENLLRLLA